MDTTAGLEELVAPLGLDLVFLVQKGRHVAIIGAPNARGAQPRPSNAIIQRTRPKVQGQGSTTIMMRLLHYRIWRPHWSQFLPVLKLVKKQAMVVMYLSAVHPTKNSQVSGDISIGATQISISPHF